MEKPVSQIFEEAVELLEQRGWCQGRVEDVNGALCAVGALGVAMTGHAHMFANRITSWQKAFFNQVVDEDFGRFVAGEDGCEVPEWNDRHGQTQQHVMDAMMGYAKVLRDRGE